MSLLRALLPRYNTASLFLVEVAASMLCVSHCPKQLTVEQQIVERLLQNQSASDLRSELSALRASVDELSTELKAAREAAEHAQVS